MTCAATVDCAFLETVRWEPHFPPVPGKETIHIWRASLRHHQPAMDALFGQLQPQEQNRASRFYRAEDKARFVLARGMLRYLIAKHLSIAPSAILFRANSNGKQFCVTADKNPLLFNLSHAGNWVLVAIGLSATGVDVEAIKAGISIEELSATCFSAEERRLLQEAPDRLHPFYQLWTRKEALLKATGVGLVDELSQFSCLSGTNKIAPAIIWSGQDWQVRSFYVDDEHMGSVAAAPAVRLQFFDFDACNVFL